MMNQKGAYLLWQNTTFWLQIVLRSSVAKNAASLYVIQFANYILPLITVPYLVKVLGPAGFGVVSFGQSLIAYFALFVDYGFALSATRKISVERENFEAVSHTVFNVWAAKTLLCIAGAAVLLLLITMVPKLREVSLLLLILYGTVIGNVLFPVWLFQGMEKMVMISVINLVVRILFVIGIFTLVHRPEDYLVYAGLTSLSSIGAGIAGVVVAVYMFKLRFAFPSWRGIWEALVGGWMLFLSMASVSLYTVGNAFILGLLTNPTIVGYYSAAEKIVKAVSGLLGPISQATYPRFSKMASESKALALKWGRRMLLGFGGLGLVATIVLITGAPIITKVMLGSEYERSIIVMQILAIWVFINAITNVWGIQIMIPLGYDKQFFVILLLAGIINLSLAIILAPLWMEKGMAISVIIACLFVTISQPLFLKRKGISVFLWRG